MNKLFLSILFTLLTFYSFAQGVSINNTGAVPNPNAMLDVSADDKGVLVTRLTTVARTTLGTALGAGDNGMLVYDKDLLVFYYWDGTQWVLIGTGTGSDNQNLTGASLTGTSLQIDIENGNSATVDLAPLQDGTGTDTQNLTGATLSGTSLQIDIENGNPAVVDLAPLQDGTGTDNQHLTGASLTGTSLQIDIEDGNSAMVDLVGLQDGTGTDNQHLTGASLTGTSLQIDIEDGNSAMVDLAGLQDGTGTDNQDLSLSGDILSLSNDGTPVDLSTLKDHDWYEVGGTTQSDAITDRIYTEGRVGIGTNNPLREFHVRSGLTYVSMFESTGSNSGISFPNSSSTISTQAIRSAGNNMQIINDATPMLHIDGGTANYSHVGIGTSTPDTKLTIRNTDGRFIKMESEGLVGNAASTNYMGAYDTQGDRFWYLGEGSSIDKKITLAAGSASITDYNMDFELGGTSRMYIQSDGDIGIGTTSPTEKLEVQGAVKIVDGTEGDGKVLTSDGSGKASWQTPSTSLLLSVAYPQGNATVPDSTFLAADGVVTLASFTAPSDGLYMVCAVATITIKGGLFGDYANFQQNSQTYFGLFGGGSSANEEHLSEDPTKQISVSYLFDLTAGEVVDFRVGQQRATAFGFYGLEMRVVKF